MSTSTTPKPVPTNLGTMIADHPQIVVGSRGRMIQTYLAFAIGGLFLLAGAIAFVVMAEGTGQTALICLGFAGFCTLGIGAMGLGDARRTKNMSLQLYAHGLLYNDKAGQKTWLWSDITQLLFNSHRMPNTNIVQYVYQVNHSNGESITFHNHVHDPAAAFRTIAHHVYPLLLPSLQADFVAGRPVVFGILTLDSAGMHVKNKHIPWSEATNISLSGSSLFIEKNGGGLLNQIEINTGEVPNVELAIQLMRQKVKS